MLEIQTRARLEQVQEFASRLRVTNRSEIITTLNALRRSSDALEMTVFGPNNQILGITSVELEPATPRYSKDEVLLQLRQDRPYVGVEPRPDGQYQIIAAAVIAPAAGRDEFEFIQATFPLEQRLSVLANAVQGSYNQFTELAFLRTALKYSFTLTLSLVLLISLLASVYGAFYLDRKSTRLNSSH